MNNKNLTCPHTQTEAKPSRSIPAAVFAAAVLATSGAALFPGGHQVLAGGEEASGGETSVLHQHAMADWRAEAARHISERMRYPWSPRGLPDGYAMVRLRIDHDGRVQEAAFVERSRVAAFTTASKTFARSIESLPALPDGIASNGAFVTVNLVYASSEAGRAKVFGRIAKREAQVGVAPLALIRRPGNSSLSLAQADLPVIELAAGS
ncbi:MAG: hypothetical protein D6757_06305 [Alphaproteobacteria bacterium]|nr:MAG: hypothetical protein D6757_06305 [Alphaproteobacteria bacterium]